MPSRTADSSVHRAGHPGWKGSEWRNDGDEWLFWARVRAQMPLKSFSGLGSSVLSPCLLFSSAWPGRWGELVLDRMTSENLSMSSISTPGTTELAADPRARLARPTPRDGTLPATPQH